MKLAKIKQGFPAQFQLSEARGGVEALRGVISSSSSWYPKKGFGPKQGENWWVNK
jgi:hypothetical protein